MITKEILEENNIFPIKFEIIETKDEESCNFYIIYYTENVYFYISEYSDIEYYLTIYKKTLKSFKTINCHSLDKVIKTIKDEIQTE